MPPASGLKLYLKINDLSVCLSDNLLHHTLWNQAVARPKNETRRNQYCEQASATRIANAGGLGAVPQENVDI